MPFNAESTSTVKKNISNIRVENIRWEARQVPGKKQFGADDDFSPVCNTKLSLI